MLLLDGVNITKSQDFILENLVRVKRKQLVKIHSDSTARYELDGKDCTAQIVSLVVKGLIATRKANDRPLVRL